MHQSIRVCVVAACCLAVPAGPAAAQPAPDDAQPTPEDAQPTPESAPELPGNWFETRLVIEDLAEAGDFEAIAALTDHLLELTRAEFGPDSAGVADAHLFLARIHRRNEDYTLADEHIARALEIYETTAGPLSPALIDPLLELGDNYNAAGDYVSAISAYSEARTIGRRNFGLLNEDQLPIIDDMTEAAEQLGNLEEAQALQLEALTLIERNHGELSPEALEARYKFAAWLREHHFYDEERRHYFQIQRIIDQEYDADPLMTVRALRERAESYRQQDSGDPLGLSGLRDALEIVESMPDPPRLLMAQLLVDIGDWSVEFSRTGAIGDDYIRAWHLLGEVENGADLRRQWFDQLTEVEVGTVSLRGLSTDPDAPQGYVVVYFTVSESGRTRDIEITDSNPPGIKDSAVARVIREARFRPGIVDGELVTARRAYRFEFRYEAQAP